MPRSFYAATTPLDVLVVGMNPGRLPLDKEREAYRDLTGVALVRTQLPLTQKLIEAGGTRFARQLMRYLDDLLGLHDDDSVFRRVAVTQLVKCQSAEGFDHLHPLTVDECFRRHLTREIEFFRPKAILAVGREVEQFLAPLYPSAVIYVHHASRTGLAQAWWRAHQRDVKARVKKLISGSTRCGRPRLPKQPLAQRR